MYIPKKNGTVYASYKACCSCTCRCTDGLKPKEVKFGPATVYVPMHMYGTPDRPLQQIPSDAVQPDPYHAFDRASQKAAYILLTIRKDVEKQKKDAHP